MERGFSGYNIPNGNNHTHQSDDPPFVDHPGRMLGQIAKPHEHQRIQPPRNARQISSQTHGKPPAMRLKQTDTAR